MKDRTSLSSLLAKCQEDLPPRRMKDSYIEIHLPLGSQHGLREKYLNVHNSVRTVSFRSRVLPPNSVWMEDAKLKGLEICHPQERNIFNRIFGGFLMRKAYELGWANACTYGGSRPHLVAVDDIMFQKPVEIGSLLFLSSQVCYTKTNHIQVRVHTEVFDSQSGKHNTTNIFHFTFCSEKEVPQIVPKSYGESMLYLDGKRHFDITFNGTPAV
ncbi:UNVERIFIED_CONTAM: hypothetical protein FKN15_030863 [Acipenser sinensis]